MILIDFSQVVIANVHRHLKIKKSGKNHKRLHSISDNIGAEEDGDPNDPQSLRRMTLSSIRSAKRGFSKEYGQLVICADGYQYWREEVFPYYKAARKAARKESQGKSEIDWSFVFATMTDIREEIQANFPYRVLRVPHAEADDIIGTLVMHKHKQERILIVSGDGDFAQLQAYDGVDQYSPAADAFIVADHPKRDLKEKILRGDRGDGIPNILSPLDILATKGGDRQKRMYQDKVDVWLTQKPEEFCDKAMLERYNLNRKLIDLSLIPENVQKAILQAWEEPIIGTKKTIFPYLVKHQMSTLLDGIHQF